MKFELIGHSESEVIVPIILNTTKVSGVLFESQNNVLIDSSTNAVHCLAKDKQHYHFRHGAWLESTLPELIERVANGSLYTDEDDSSIIVQTPLQETRIRLKDVRYIVPEYVKTAALQQMVDDSNGTVQPQNGTMGFIPSISIILDDHRQDRIFIGSDYMAAFKKLYENICLVQDKPSVSKIIIELPI